MSEDVDQEDPERVRESQEKIREAQEVIREENEYQGGGSRERGERARVSSERAREGGELGRAGAEGGRESAERSREAREQARVDAFNTLYIPQTQRAVVAAVAAVLILCTLTAGGAYVVADTRSADRAEDLQQSIDELRRVR